MNKFSESLKYGKQKEVEVLPHIKEYFNSKSIKIPKNKYSTYDFIDDNNEVIYELKSRTNKYNQYPTTMIQEDKILKNVLKLLIIYIMIMSMRHLI